MRGGGSPGALVVYVAHDGDERRPVAGRPRRLLRVVCHSDPDDLEGVGEEYGGEACASVVHRPFKRRPREASRRKMTYQRQRLQ